MKLIALRGLHLTPKMKRLVEFEEGYEHGTEDKPIEGKHHRAINQGDRFTIGGTLDLKRMGEEERILTLELIRAGTVACTDGDEGKRICDEVDAEVALAAKQREEARNVTAAGSLAEQVKVILATLAAQGLIVVPPAKPGAAKPVLPPVGAKPVAA